MVRAFLGTWMAAAVAWLAAAAPARPASLPVVYNGPIGYARVSRTVSPPGANNWACKPSRAHPYPVVLVHGTFADMSDTWRALSPLLADQGYCVFALNYGAFAGSGRLGIYGTGPIESSARQLATFVDRVLGATHARQVDVVGHSQGGTMPRYYIKFLGGAPKVHTLVGLAPSNHGTTLNGFVKLARVFRGGPAFVGSRCPACIEQLRGSRFLQALNAGSDTVPGVRYTVVQSRYDEVVTPYTSAFLTGRNVTDILLQQQCGLDHGEHLSMPYDHIADRDVLNALDPAHAARPRCTVVLPVVGG